MIQGVPVSNDVLHHCAAFCNQVSTNFPTVPCGTPLNWQCALAEEELNALADIVFESLTAEVEPSRESWNNLPKAHSVLVEFARHPRYPLIDRSTEMPVPRRRGHEAPNEPS